MSNLNQKIYFIKQTHSETIAAPCTFAEYDSAEVLAFLQRVEPLMINELGKNIHSKAFHNYDLSIDGEERVSVDCIHSLINDDMDAKMPVTGLSWNCIGSVIAVSYGRLDHEDWCTHGSCVSTWNIERPKMVEHKPDTIIDQPCCVMCVSYHFSSPALLAAGNFNGEVFVWDMKQSHDRVVGHSGQTDQSHKEPVNALEWISKDFGSTSSSCSLASIGGDGKVIIWQLNVQRQTFSPVNVFTITIANLPSTLRGRGGGDRREISLTCLTFRHDDSGLFIIGSDSGAIFHCSTIESKSGSAPSSPVMFTYSPHHAPVYAVDFSPLYQNLFISSSLDQTLRIYHIRQHDPVLVLEPDLGYLYSVEWSVNEPAVIMAVSANGHLLVYDLAEEKTNPILVFDQSKQSYPLYAMSLNKQRSSILAMGDCSGLVSVVKINKETSNSGIHGSLEALDKLHPESDD